MVSTKLTTGAGYVAVDNGDGMFTIRDVPIFAEVPAGEKGAPRPIGRPWMVAALQRNKRRAVEGFLHPLHIRHHDMVDQTEPAGHFELTRIAPLRFDGKTRLTMFADLHVHEDVYQRVKARKLPYRSVEVFDWSEPDINSLALLDTDEPFFRFEMLQIRDEIPAGGKASRFKADPVAAFVRSRRGGAYLFNATGAALMDEDKDRADLMGDDEDEKGEEMQNEDESKDEPTSADLAAGLSAVQSTLEKLVTAITGAEDEDEDETAPAEMENDEDEDKDKGADMKKADRTVLTRLEAEVAALKQRDAKRDRASKVETMVREAEAELRGWTLTDDTRAAMTRAATAGAENLKDFVATFKRHVDPDPPTNLEDEITRAADDDSDLDGFRADPAQFKLAARSAAEYDQLVKLGRKPRGGREKFIERNVTRLAQIEEV